MGRSHYDRDLVREQRAIAFAEQLADALYTLRLTHEDLVTALGVRQDTVASWLRRHGEAKIPKEPTFSRLCALLDARSPGLGRTLAAAAGLHWAAPAPFPAAATPTARTNLPAPLTSFIGRAEELAALQTALAEHRLLTLAGPGGIGKTRLAREVGAACAAAYADGVWLVELAPLADPALVPGAVAAVLGVREQPGQPLDQILTATLQPRHLLLILDNCEHLIDACAVLAARLLGACPQVTILATSREVLRVPGEVVWHVPPLALPDPAPDGIGPPEELPAGEAVQLFTARAQAAQPAFALTPHTAPLVHDLCRRLDGLPLALELAAARLRLLTLEQIVARLDDRFPLLTGGSRVELLRHQTLWAAIEWSYDLLAEPERAVFGQLSVFAGSWTLEAAEAICGGGWGLGVGGWNTEFAAASINADPESTIQNPNSPTPNPQPPTPAYDVLELLTQLVDKSLVSVDTQGPAARYRLLETMREYAATRLTDPAVFDRLIAYFVGYTEDHQADYAALDPELPNIVAALQAAHERAQREALVRGANALYRYLEARGLYGLAAAQLARAEQAARATGDGAGLTDTLLHQGRLAEQRGDYAQAEAALREGLALARSRDDRAQISTLLQNLGGVALKRGDYEQAEAYLLEGVAVARPLGDADRLSALLGNLGVVAGSRGDHARAEAIFRESLALAQQIDHRERISRLLQNLGAVAGIRGDYRRAAAYYRRGLRLARAVGHREQISFLLQNLGATATSRGDYRRARADYQKGLALAREIAHRERISYLLEKLGELERTCGHPNRARAYLREGLALAREIGHRERICHLLLYLGLVAGDRGADPQAVSYLQQSLDLAQEIGHRWFTGVIWNAWGELHLRQGAWQAAESAFAQALAIAHDATGDMREQVGLALYGRARVALALDQIAAARQAGQESLETLTAIGHHQAAEVQAWLDGLPAEEA